MTDSTSAPVLACSLTAPAAAERAQRWRSLLDVVAPPEAAAIVETMFEIPR